MRKQRDLPFWEEYEKLMLLIDQGQFELILPEEDRRQDIRLVYLMNDAVESFLVFRKARLTGKYQPDFQGELWADLEKDGQQYVLVLHQENSVCTLFFENLELEVHLYDYGKTGHFWVKEYEYLRQLEYRIAILKDKLEYLGKEFCTEEEEKLAYLAEFPPLNYCCYPAVSEKYVVPSYPRWQVSKRAIQVMQEFAEEAGDIRMKRLLTWYAKFPGKFTAKWMALHFRRSSHSKIVDLLTRKLEMAAAGYGERVFEEAEEEKIRTIKEKALARKKQLEQSGKQVDMLKEEPFLYVKDSVEYKIHLMIWKSEGKNRKVDVETIE